MRICAESAENCEEIGNIIFATPLKNLFQPSAPFRAVNTAIIFSRGRDSKIGSKISYFTFFLLESTYVCLDLVHIKTITDWHFLYSFWNFTQIFFKFAFNVRCFKQSMTIPSTICVTWSGWNSKEMLSWWLAVFSGWTSRMTSTRARSVWSERNSFKWLGDMCNSIVPEAEDFEFEGSDFMLSHKEYHSKHDINSKVSDSGEGNLFQIERTVFKYKQHDSNEIGSALNRMVFPCFAKWN